MRRRSLPALAVSLFAISLPLFAACSSSTDEGSAASAPQGPLSGTYSSDSMDGNAPFVAITFLDASHYSFIASTCSDPGSSGDMAEDDPADAVMDADEDPSTGAADADGCVHVGTYKVTGSDLLLTEDGASDVVDVPIGELALDGSEVTDPSATVGAGPLTHTDSLTTNGSKSLVASNAGLFGQMSVNAFSAGGRAMRRTGLSSASPSSGSLVTAGPVAAARQWVDAKMPYCQAANHGHEIDASCLRVHGSTCNRTGAAAQPQWNAYRSDCSGLVSMSWSLKPPGLTTREFTPRAAKFIPAQDLQPGDALLRAGHHIVLFEKWVDKDHGKAMVLAEPGCSARGGPFAQEQPWSLGHAPGASPGGSWNGTTYQAIRKNGSTLKNQ